MEERKKRDKVKEGGRETGSEREREGGERGREREV